jgi:hypothetical protein
MTFWKGQEGHPMDTGKRHMGHTWDSTGERGREDPRQAPAQPARVAQWVRVGGVGGARPGRGRGDAHARSAWAGQARILREAPGAAPGARGAGRLEAARGSLREPGERQRQEVPYRHTATLPPHPLRSRRSAPTLVARPRRPTWPPHAQS